MKPWIEGPLELLKHGLEHLQLDSDFDSRVAMISIDNAVELMIKVFLGLPKRVTGIHVSRNKYSEITQTFPNLLDGLEELASDKLTNIDLGDIEWYHRLRNQLYHDGNGITVEKSRVEAYGEIATIFFSNLFDVDIKSIDIKPLSILGEFYLNWAEVEQNLRKMIDLLGVSGNLRGGSHFASRELEAKGIISKKTFNDLNLVRRGRNEIIHGMTPPDYTLIKNMNEILLQILKEFEKILKKLEKDS